MNNALSTNFGSVIESVLPALSGSGITYNEEKNIFLSSGYTSAAGNTYYQGLRLSDRIIVNYDFGQGYAYLFLNGIRIYGYNGREKRLLSSRSYYSQCFSEGFAKRECEEMVKEYIVAEMKLLNATVNDRQVSDFSKQLVACTLNNKLLK